MRLSGCHCCWMRLSGGCEVRWTTRVSKHEAIFKVAFCSGSIDVEESEQTGLIDFNPSNLLIVYFSTRVHVDHTHLSTFSTNDLAQIYWLIRLFQYYKPRYLVLTRAFISDPESNRV